ncbi:shikimate dehydrogenase, partial [Variovorax sp. 2RAF20]
VGIVNRTVSKAQAIADALGDRVTAAGEADLPALLAEAGLVINATSLGLGGGDGPPSDLTLTPQGCVVMDMVYKPLRTEFLQRAQAAGRSTVDGLE